MSHLMMLKILYNVTTYKNLIMLLRVLELDSCINMLFLIKCKGLQYLPNNSTPLSVSQKHQKMIAISILLLHQVHIANIYILPACIPARVSGASFLPKYVHCMLVSETALLAICI